MRSLIMRVLWPAAVIVSVAYLALMHSGMRDNELAGTPITLRSPVSGE